MRNILISEQQFNRLFVIKEAADNEFNVEMLDKIRSFRGRFIYCKEHLGNAIGKGSSRAVFQIDDEKILKLAINSKGITQNAAEDERFIQTYGITTKVFDSNDEGLWIISEFAIPAKKSDFPICLGITFEEYCEFIKKSSARYLPRHKRFFSKMTDERYDDLLENNEWLSGLDDYLGDYQIKGFNDLMVLRNIGMTQRDRKPTIVLLDYGWNNISYEEYQSRWK